MIRKIIDGAKNFLALDNFFTSNANISCDRHCKFSSTYIDVSTCLARQLRDKQECFWCGWGGYSRKDLINMLRLV